jgi:intein/homing endonuclease
MSTDASTIFSGRIGIPKNLHPACEACIANAREKYTGFMSDEGTYHKDGFAVNCPYIPHDEKYFPDKFKSQMSPEEWALMNSLKSPLLWGEANLVDPDNGKPWKAWDYQRAPLLCASPRKCYRFGRRTGKCRTRDSDITLADGSINKMGDLVGHTFSVWSIDPNTFKYTKVAATAFENGDQPCVRVGTKYGHIIECTRNHPFLTCDGWVSVETGLSIGNRIATPITNPNIGSEVFDKRLLSLLGYLLGDGSFYDGSSLDVRFTVSIEREDVLQHFLSLLNGTYRINKKVHNNCNCIALHMDNDIVSIIQELGLRGKNSHTKFIPPFVFKLNSECIVEFLRPLFTTDGWSDNRGNIGYCSASKELATGVKRLLSRLGIVSSIRIKTIKSGRYSGNEYYTVDICNYSETKKFEEIIGLKYKGYKYSTSSDRNSYNSQLRSMPKEFSFKFAKKLRRVVNTVKQRNSFGYIREDHAVGREVLTKWAEDRPEYFKDELTLLNSDLYWDEIVFIEDIGIVPTVGLSVPGTENYVSDVVEHNSTILAVEILWYLFTSGGGRLRDPDTGRVRQNLTVMLLAPQKVHVDNIFQRIRAFLTLSPKLSNNVAASRRGSPQYIGLKTKDGGDGNGVSGFASGDASGSKGLSGRGQDADLIVLDEGAFVSEDVMMNVINPILYTRPTTSFIVSSTPSGISGDYFEKVCTRRPDFVEFYVPASMRPDWDKVKDQVRKDFGSSQDEWNKEVMAEFSPAGIGVYRDDLVKLAQSDYAYGDMHRHDGYIYTFGIDWNKEHGTEIAVVATARSAPHVSWTAFTENIPKEEFTTPAGIQRVVELNRIWRPMWIYADEGGGDGAAMLRHHGRMSVGKNPIDAVLKDIVKSYDFGSKLEIIEADGTMVKYPAKPFMVENSVKKFELGEFKYPRGDLLLTKQLNNYVVDRRTPAGIPVYAVKEKKWGDHKLDAVNLALIAVRLELPSFTQGSVGSMGTPVIYIPTEQAKSERAILPMSVPNRRLPDSSIRSDPTYGKKVVVRYWGTEPNEAIAEARAGRRNQPRGRRFGR